MDKIKECSKCYHAVEDHRVIKPTHERTGMGTHAELRCSRCECRSEVVVRGIYPTDERRAG